MVPMSRYRRDARVVSVLIEINRSLYMDEERGTSLATLPGMATAIREIIAAMIRE